MEILQQNSRPAQSRLAYGRIAEAYDTFLTMAGFKAGVERFLDRLNFGLPPKARLLDAGCGTGLIAFYLARRFPDAEITAFDIDRAMLTIMERQIRRRGLIPHPITIAQGDLNAPERLRRTSSPEVITLKPDYFDGIFVSGALEHAPLEAAATELVKLLKPGGIFFNLGVRKSATGMVLGMMYRFRPYTIHETRRAFETAGLAEIRTLRLSVEDFPANLSRIAVIAKKEYRK